MTDMPIQAHRHRSRLAGKGAWRVYFALLYPFVLVVTLFAQLAPRAQAAGSEPAHHANVFNEAAASLSSALSWMDIGR